MLNGPDRAAATPVDTGAARPPISKRSRSMLLRLSRPFGAMFILLGSYGQRGGGAGVLGYGQDRVGPRGQALNRSRPAGQVGVRGRPTDRSKASTRGCGSRLAGQAAPGAWGASRAGGGRPRGRRSV